MGCLLIPKDLCHHLESIISHFWWGCKNGERKIHWIKWDGLCKQKKGGMGFRSFRDFNEALLAWKSWHILSDPNSLIGQVLKARYFPRKDTLSTSIGYSPSYIWWRIHHASWVIKKGSSWGIGNGGNMNIWRITGCLCKLGFSAGALGLPTVIFIWLIIFGPRMSAWDINILRPIFLPFEANFIAQIPIPMEHCEEKLIWGWSKEGFYTVKSRYHFIKHQVDSSRASSSFDPNIGLWNKLWKINSPQTPSSNLAHPKKSNPCEE